MDPGIRADDAQRLSDLIGAIYDCAIDPGRWEATLSDIRDFLDCQNAMLYLYDPAIGAARISVVVGIEPQWLETMLRYTDSVSELFHHVADYETRPIDEAVVLRREVPDEVMQTNRYVIEWGRPQGIDDSLHIMLLRESTRVSLLSLGRHESAGYVTDRDVRLIELLAPHLRRAVAISDLIDLKTIEADTLGNTLDTIAAAIMVVDKGGTILRANEAAAHLLERGSPLNAVEGKLRATDPAIDERLKRAITAAADDRGETGASGLGVALTRDPAPVSVAHVLPVARGDVRARLVPGAVAAIFVSSADDAPRIDLKPMADAYGLTPAETRLLGRIAIGESLPQAAVALNVTQNTLKTHLSRIMAKTGTNRQPALLALVNRLAPALQPGRQA
jgi:DNA-binding CsgD family transcriptional regulator